MSPMDGPRRAHAFVQLEPGLPDGMMLLDVTPEAVGEAMALLPSTVRVDGSEYSPFGGPIRLRLQALVEGLPHGQVQLLIADDGGVRSARLVEVHDV